jgi:hypothetical protein
MVNVKSIGSLLRQLVNYCSVRIGLLFGKEAESPKFRRAVRLARKNQNPEVSVSGNLGALASQRRLSYVLF